MNRFVFIMMMSCLIAACTGDAAPTPTSLPHKLTTSVAATGGPAANLVETTATGLPRVSGFRAVAGRNSHTLSWNAIGESEYRVTIDGQSVRRKVDGYVITYGGRSDLDSDGKCTHSGKCDEVQILRSEGRTTQQIDQKGDTTFAVIQAVVNAKHPQLGRPSSTLRIVRTAPAEALAQAPRYLAVGDIVGAATHLDSVPYAVVRLSFENRGWTKETQFRRGGGGWRDLSGETCPADTEGNRDTCHLTVPYGAADTLVRPGQRYTFRTRQSRSATNKSAWLTSEQFESRPAPPKPGSLSASKSDSLLTLSWVIEGLRRDTRSDLPVMHIVASKSTSRTGTATVVDTVESSMDNVPDGLGGNVPAWVVPQSIGLLLSELGAGSHWLHATSGSVNGIEGGTSSIRVRIAVNAGDTTVTTIDSTYVNPEPTPAQTNPNALLRCLWGGTSGPRDCFPPGPPVLDTVIVTETRTSARATARWSNPLYVGGRLRNNGDSVAARITRIEQSWEAVSNTGSTASGSGSNFSRSFTEAITQWKVTFKARAWNNNPTSGFSWHSDDAVTSGIVTGDDRWRKGPEQTGIVYLYRPPETTTPTLRPPSSVSTRLSGDSVIVTWGAVSGITSDVGTYAVYEDSAGTQMKVGAFDDRRVARPVEWYQDTAAVRLRFGVASVHFGNPDRESTIRWSGYVTIPAKVTTTTPTTPTPRPTGVTAVAGWSWGGDETDGYVRGIRVTWRRAGNYGCTNYELQGKESSSADFVVLHATTTCGGAGDYREDVKRMENAVLLKAGTSYRFRVVAEYIISGSAATTRVTSSEVSRTTCSSSTSVPAANQNNMGNPFRNCNGTVR